MKGTGLLTALFFICPAEANAQENWYLRAETGPLFSMSYSIRNGFIANETDRHMQYGISGGNRLGDSYFSVETGLYRQSHSTIARITNTEATAQSGLSTISTEYTVYKIPLRISADLLPRQSKLGLQMVGGTSYMFKPGKQSLGEKVPGFDRLIAVDEDGRALTVSNKYYNAGAWGIEMGMRGSYSFNKQWAAEIAGMFQAGLRNMATTTVRYEGEGKGLRAYSRGDAASVLLSVRYNF